VEFDTENEIFSLLGYYAALSGSYVPTFRDNLSVASSRVEKSKKKVRKKQSFLLSTYILYIAAEA
jgi:hypothetical protein